MNTSKNPTSFALARLPVTGPTPFLILPEGADLERLRGELDLSALRKLRLEGRLIPSGKQDWRLEAKLGATVVQPCSVTLAPVTTRIDVPVERNYLANYSAPSETESEMPEDDSAEPLPANVDLMAILAEELAIAVPDFPRAEGVELGEAVFAAPETAPLRDDDVKPFAGLAELKKRMQE